MPRRRIRSIAPLRAARMIQAPGSSGNPSRGQRSSAVANASWTHLLGQVEVAHAAREDTDGPAEPLPVEPADGLALQRLRRAHICATGRTSTAPKRALGMRAAASMAWSSVAQSTR